MNDQIRDAAYRTIPALTGSTYAGLTMNEWAAVLTIIYVAMQIGLLVWDRAKGRRK